MVYLKKYITSQFFAKVLIGKETVGNLSELFTKSRFLPMFFCASNCQLTFISSGWLVYHFFIFYVGIRKGSLFLWPSKILYSSNFYMKQYILFSTILLDGATWSPSYQVLSLPSLYLSNTILTIPSFQGAPIIYEK